jgi:hypothetical protein
MEEAGLATVCLVMQREVAENVIPPRALFVPFPLGAPLGPPGDIATQRGVLLELLEALDQATEPGTIIYSPRLWKR